MQYFYNCNLLLTNDLISFEHLDIGLNNFKIH